MIQASFFAASHEIFNWIIRNRESILVGNGHIFWQCHQNVRTHYWIVETNEFQIRNYLILVEKKNNENFLLEITRLQIEIKTREIQQN